MNTQTPLSIDRQEDGSLLVHSIFETIQAEGPYAGEAALFVRLAGCNLQCPFCDTVYTGGTRFASSAVLFEHLCEAYNNVQLIVVTGGEPFRQNIAPFVRLAAYAQRRVQIETNGVLYPGSSFPWSHHHVTVVCSPKTGRIHPATARLAHVYKYVLSHDNVAEDGLPIVALGHPLGDFPHVARPPEGWAGAIYIQPLDSKDPGENQKNMQAVAASVMKHRRYIMGVQMNKLVGLP